METKLQENLEDRNGNYILPFFWQHGESKELLTEGVDRIFESGIRALCVESRPHPDFLGDQWWSDLRTIIDRAKSHSMQVWVLDDAHFPSGYCNGRIASDSPYRKVYLTHYGIDVAGPRHGCSFLVDLKAGEKLIGVLIGRRNPDRPHELSEVADLSANVESGKVYAEIPGGLWTIIVIKTTFEGTGRKNYINTIDRDAVGFFIHEVYEAHYQHFGDEFGRTFAGFFSDEPEIGNCGGEYGFQSVIGQPEMNLPWCKEAEDQLRKLWHKDFSRNILSLWEDIQDETDCSEKAEENSQPTLAISPIHRKEFMDVISRLYSTNFCCQIGDWCRAHGVQYIGHVIEDNGTHTHLGLGTGHYFRALKGQDMAGIDVVLQQLRPEMDSFRFRGIGGNMGYDGTFFHYVLANLGTSLASLDRLKQGRTMCEIFGAYGWSEGLKMMKWLLNHMLVNGVNWFVPHAFTMKDFPDPDCPPHFYARGMNPQFPYFRSLMQYTNRVCHLLQGTRKAAHLAVFYPAEQEWMGGEYTRLEDICELLTRNQIDFLIVPEDSLAEWTRSIRSSVSRASSDLHQETATALQSGVLEDQRSDVLTVQQSDVLTDPRSDVLAALRSGISGDQRSDVLADSRSDVPANPQSDKSMNPLYAVTDLIVPGSTYISGETASILSDAAESGMKIWWVGKMPQVVYPDENSRPLDHCIRAYRLMTWTDFFTSLQGDSFRDITLENSENWLRYGHFADEKADYYLFFNESDLQWIRTNVCWNEDLPAENTPPCGKQEQFMGQSVQWARRQNVQQSMKQAELQSMQQSIKRNEQQPMQHSVQQTVQRPVRKKTFYYDAWKNTLEACFFRDDRTLALHLAPGEMKIACRMKAEIPEEWETIISDSMQRQRAFDCGSVQNMTVQKILVHGWQISVREAGQKDFHPVPQEGTAGNSDALGDFGREHPSFSGTIRYEITFSLDPLKSGIQYADLDLGEVYETARVWMNGEDAGTVISPPYRFNVDKLLKQGRNLLRIEVTNTLVNRQRDFLSRSMPVEPSGILGPIILRVITHSV